MKKAGHFLLVQILTMVFCTALYAGEGKDGGHHTCDDKEEWARWGDMIKKYPEDDGLRAAYSLRVGICKEIEDGTIDTQRAINIFERYLMWMKVERQ